MRLVPNIQMFVCRVSIDDWTTGGEAMSHFLIEVSDRALEVVLTCFVPGWNITIIFIGDSRDFGGQIGGVL